MAINETYTNKREVVSQPEVIVSNTMRRPLFPAIRWSAILAGVAVGISTQLLLTLLGLALGLSTTSITEGETVGTGPLLWAGFSMLVAAFIGGYVASRMSGLKRKSDGVLHGAVSWAVTTLLFALLATSLGGSLLSGVFNGMNQVSGGANGQSPLAAIVRAQGGNMDAATVRQLQQYLQNGQRDQAVQLVSRTMGVDQNRASTIVDQALIVTGSPEAASPQARQAADTAVRTAGNAAWLVFVPVALALALGIGGGMLGAAGARRTPWAGGVGVGPTPQRA